MKKEIKEWIDIADKDVQMAKVLLQEGDLTSGVSFHCQQAIEKYFKAYPIDNNWELQKTHNLIKLYAKVKELKDMGLDEKLISDINIIYMETRYPNPYSVPTQAQAKTFLEFTKQVQKTIKQELIFPPNTQKN
jgi:HEPN domain-containing protein